MATVDIPVRSFTDRELLPSVCAATGGRPDTTWRVTARRTPFWVWFLVLVPIAFLPAWVLLTESVSGDLPVRDVVRRRLAALRAVRAVAVAIVVGSLVGELWGLTPGNGLIWAGLALAVAVAASPKRSRYGISARLDATGEHVVLSGVAPPFAQAIEGLRPFLV